jgi:hypothetical protein
MQDYFCVRDWKYFSGNDKNLNVPKILKGSKTN